GDRQVRAERQLLVDDDDAAPLAVADAGEPARLALELDLSAVGAVRVDAGEDLHQRRLAGPVLPADRVDLAPPDLQVDVLERLHRRERLGDAAHPQYRVGHAPPRAGGRPGAPASRHVTSAVP